MESINGLPAHPLFVHAPVVLVPLTAIFALVLVARPSLRRKAGWALAASSVVALVATQMAVSSGYEFDELLDGAVNTDHHQSLAETSRNLVILFVVSAVGSWLADRRGGGDDANRVEMVARVLSALAAVAGVAATVWMVRAGEEGARLVWSGVLAITG